MMGGSAQLLGLELGRKRPIAESLERRVRGLQLDTVAGAGQNERAGASAYSKGRPHGELFDKAFDPLPLGLSFADTHEQLVARFGPPEFSKAWDSGEMYSARWRRPGVVVFAEYLRGRPGVKSFTLMLPSAVPADPAAPAAGGGV